MPMQNPPASPAASKLRMSVLNAPLNPRSNVMASPPTVTSGATTAMSGSHDVVIALGANSSGAAEAVPLFNPPYPARSSLVTFVDGNAVAVGQREVRYLNNTLTPGNMAGAGGFIFNFDGLEFELCFVGSADQWCVVKIDDEYVSATPITVATSGLSFHRFTFATARSRRIEVRGSNLKPREMRVSPSASIYPARIRGPRVLVIGDSYPNGQGASGWFANSFVQYLKDHFGWDDVWTSASGGTGLLATLSGARPTYRQRLATDVVPWASTFDFVLVTGSTNDRVFATAAVATEYGLLIDQLRSILRPGVPIAHLFTTFQGVEQMLPREFEIKSAVSAIAAAKGVLVLDPLELPLSNTTPITGTLAMARAAGTGSGGTHIFGIPQRGGVMEIMDPDPNAVERIRVLNVVEQTNPITNPKTYIATFAGGGFKYAHAAGTPWRMVGSSYLTGRGRTTAPGDSGNCNVLVGADLHPTDAGHRALADITAALLARAVI